MGGGTLQEDSNAVGDDGLSPRGRGNLWYAGGMAGTFGSIPAWAGEPVEYARRVSRVKVYPRVGGGT